MYKRWADLPDMQIFLPNPLYQVSQPLPYFHNRLGIGWLQRVCCFISTDGPLRLSACVWGSKQKERNKYKKINDNTAAATAGGILTNLQLAGKDGVEVEGGITFETDANYLSLLTDKLWGYLHHTVHSSWPPGVSFQSLVFRFCKK